MSSPHLTEATLLKDKRERFAVSVRKQRREEILNLKRKLVLKSNQNVEQAIQLPLFSQEFYLQFIQFVPALENSYQTAKQAVLTQSYVFAPINTQESFIEHIILLKRYLELFEYPEINNLKLLTVIFSVLNRGLPEIDVLMHIYLKRYCLDILLNLTSKDPSNGLEAFFQNGHYVQLLNMLDNTPYTSLQEISIAVIRNLAADCPQFRNQVLFYGTVPRIHQYLQRQLIDIGVVSEIIWLINNICTIEPTIPPVDALNLVEPLSYIIQNAGERINVSDKNILKLALRTLKNIFGRNGSVYDYFTPQLMMALARLNPDLSIDTQPELIDIISQMSFDCKRFQIDILRGVMKMLVDGLSNVVSYGFNPENHRRDVSEKCFQAYCTAIANYMADGYQFVEMIYCVAFRNSISNFHRFLTQTKSLVAIVKLYKVLSLSATIQQLVSFLEDKNFTNWRNLIKSLFIDEAEVLLHALQTITYVFQRYLNEHSRQVMEEKSPTVNQLKLYQSFEEEGGPEKLRILEQHGNNDIWEIVDALRNMIIID